jgi:hypothetical protein
MALYPASGPTYPTGLLPETGLEILDDLLFPKCGLGLGPGLLRESGLLTPDHPSPSDPNGPHHEQHEQTEHASIVVRMREEYEAVLHQAGPHCPAIRFRWCLGWRERWRSLQAGDAGERAMLENGSSAHPTRT